MKIHIILLLISDHLKHCHQTYCCTYSFNSQVAFDVHKAKKHSVQDDNGHFICQKCEQAFQSVRTLLSHVRVDHFKHLPFKCDQCDKCFDLESKLNKHVKTVHATEFNYQCDKCEKCFKLQSSLYSHMKGVHGNETFHCDKCEFVAKTMGNLRTHQARQHSSGQWICDQCGKVFKNPESLKGHKANSHRKLEDYGEFKCTHEGCQSVFNLELGLKRHVKNVHMGKGREKNHECQYCPSTFKTPAKKIAHEKMIHLGIKDVSCDICGYKTASKEQLKKHIKRVHGTEEYKCDYPGCNKSYGIRGNMYAHKKRVHKVHWAEKFD